MAAGGLDDVRWVGQGSPELMPRSPAERFPCVLVTPGPMRQPLSAGSNRAFQQDYTFSVYYVEAYEEDQRANIEVLEAAAALFNLLIADGGPVPGRHVLAQPGDGSGPGAAGPGAAAGA